MLPDRQKLEGACLCKVYSWRSGWKRYLVHLPAMFIQAGERLKGRLQRPSEEYDVRDKGIHVASEPQCLLVACWTQLALLGWLHNINCKLDNRAF